MSERKSTVKIENGKVIFSKEILDYFDSLRTNENSEWIDKYFEVLSDTSNINSKKFNIHHIRPCCTFKDEIYKTRKETEKLADKHDCNSIKISIKNHIIAHFYLYKIFNNTDLKEAFQRMCGQGKYIDNLTEDELKDVARLKEECAKTNRTKKERKEYLLNYNKTWRKNNPEKASKQYKRKYQKHRDKILIRVANYRKNNPEKIAKCKLEWGKQNHEHVVKYKHEYYITNKDGILEKIHQICYDPIKEDYPTLGTLRQRKYRKKELYKNINPNEYIIS